MTDEHESILGPHVTTDVLADLQAGLLHDRAERAARKHLAGCPVCQADLEVLAAIPDRLAAAGSVEPMPVDVATRLDAALAAAASAPPDVAAAPTIVPLHGATSTRRRDRSSPRGLRLLQAAAVLVVVLGLGALAVSAMHGRSDGSGSTTAGAADSAGGAKAAPQAAFPVTASGRDWTPSTLTTAVPRLVAGSLSPVLARGPVSGDSLTSAAGSGGATPSPSGSATAAEAPKFAAGTNAAGRLAGGDALAECIATLVPGGATPLAVDLATYQGKPAAVILLPGLAGPDRVDIWVVPPDCSSATLYYGSVPHP